MNRYTIKWVDGGGASIPARSVEDAARYAEQAYGREPKVIYSFDTNPPTLWRKGDKGWIAPENANTHPSPAA